MKNTIRFLWREIVNEPTGIYEQGIILLKFNERVLEEAENKKVPLCERLTFASIYQSNLDDFSVCALVL